MGLRFAWDTGKADSNLHKHGLTFDEAATVFADPLAVIFDDDAHSSTEIREIVIGHSVLGRLVVVSFVQDSRSGVRIISARAATRTERREYEENRDQ